MSNRAGPQQPTWSVQALLAERGVTATAVLDRLLEVLEMTKDVELARYFSVSKATVSTWRSRNKIPFDIILLTYLEKRIDIMYCLTGEKLSALSGYPAYHAGIELAEMFDELNRRYGSPDKWRLEAKVPGELVRLPTKDDGAQ